MITADDIGRALAKCSAYDPRNTPAPSAIVIEAWLEHFEQFPKVTGGDLLRAVREYYNVHHDSQLTPVDLSYLARGYARDRIEHTDTDSQERLALEAVCDSKAAPDEEPVSDARRLAIESFARRFGISGAEAEARMQRSQGTRNELDAKAIEVAHRRMTPPAPIPCPDCGSTDVPCPCESETTTDVVS